MDYKKKLKDFLPRNQRCEEFPQNTDKEVYVPINTTDYGFMFLDKEIEKNININVDEVNTFIKILNKELDKIIIMKKLEEKKDFNYINNKLIMIEYFIGFLILIFSILTFSIEKFRQPGFYTLLVLILIIIVISSVIAVKILKDDKDFKGKDEDIYNKLKEIIKIQNKKNSKFLVSTISEMYYLKFTIIN